LFPELGDTNVFFTFLCLFLCSLMFVSSFCYVLLYFL
jgi:hypothetical protein